MKMRIVGSSNDEFAVVFYGAAKTNIENQVFDHVYVYAPLDVPDAATIRKLQDFDVDSFIDDVGVGDAAGTQAAQDLRFGLWAARDMFMQKSSKAAKRVILFSNNEDPCSDAEASRRLRDQIMVRAEELHSLAVSLDFFPLAALLRSFDLSLFWNDLIAAVGGEDAEESVIPGTHVEAKLDSLYMMARKRSFKKRPLAALRLDLTPELQIAVQMFSLVQPASRRPPIMIHSRDYEVLRTSTGYICMDTGAMLTDLSKKYYALSSGDKERFPKVVVRQSELKDIKHVRPPGLTLLGFKPVSELKDYHQIQHANFLYPDERSLKGSTAAFIAIHQALLSAGKFALCRMVRNSSAAPILVALLPQEEVLDEFGNQLEPPGLHLIYLPFQDDLRAPEAEPALVGLASSRADEAQIQAAEQLMERLHLTDFYCNNISNPVLVRHFDIIEKVALGDPLPAAEDLEDDTLPDVEGQALHADAIQAFQDACYGKEYAQELATRKAAGGAGAAKSKGTKRKEEAELTQAEAYQQIDWKRLADTGGLQKLTVEQLKLYLTYHRLKKDGRKADLIARIQEHVQGGE
eukprot:jgi/Chrzof1/7808/Cz02g37100.t1